MKHTSTLALIALAGLALVGCSTQQVTPPGNPVPQAVSVAGIVGGSNGLLTLNGSPLDLSTASFVNGLSLQAETGRETIKPGMEIEGDGDDHGGKIKMRSLEVRWRARGTVDAVSTDTIDVVGLHAVVDNLTRIFKQNTDGSETALTLADIKAGDYVKLAGLPKDDDSIQATRLEVISASDSKQTDIFTKVRNLDTTAKTFTYGLKSYTVNYSSAQVIGTLSEGGAVRVKGTHEGSALTAQLVKAPQTEGKPKGRRHELKGIITSLDETAKTFTLRDFTVNYTGATVKGTLVKGAVVEVRGTINADKTVTATQVEVEDHSGKPSPVPGQPPVLGSKIEGPVSSFDATTKTLKIAGVSVSVKVTTKYEINDAEVSADVFWGTGRDGQRAEARGVIAGAVMEADKLEIE